MSVGKMRGFTLLELMIVVAVIAVLATLAMTSYVNYGFRARRTAGQQYLMNMAAGMERYYTQFNRYPNTAADINFTGASSDLGKAGGDSSGPFYNVTITGGGTQAYTLTAAPANNQAVDKCGSLTITNLSVKSQTGVATNGNCW